MDFLRPRYLSQVVWVWGSQEEKPLGQGLCWLCASGRCAPERHIPSTP